MIIETITFHICLCGWRADHWRLVGVRHQPGKCDLSHSLSIAAILDIGFTIGQSLISSVTRWAGSLAVFRTRLSHRRLGICGTVQPPPGARVAKGLFTLTLRAEMIGDAAVPLQKAELLRVSDAEVSPSSVAITPGLFKPARLDIEIKDRFGNPVIPREWFLAPLFVIDEAVDRIRDGSIADYVYDPKSASLAELKR